MQFPIRKAWPRPMDGIIPAEGRYPGSLHDLAHDAMTVVHRGEDEPAPDNTIDAEDLDLLIGFSLALEAEHIEHLRSIMVAVEKDGVVTSLEYVGPGADTLPNDALLTCRPLTVSEADRFSRADDDIAAPFYGWDHATSRPKWSDRLPPRLSWVRERHLLAAWALWKVEEACTLLDVGDSAGALQRVGLAGTAMASARYFLGWEAADAQAADDGAPRDPGLTIDRQFDARALGRLGGLKRQQRMDRARNFVLETYRSRDDWKSKADFARRVREDVLRLAPKKSLSAGNVTRTILDWLRRYA